MASRIIAFALAILIFASPKNCGANDDLGSAKNPIKFFLAPSIDTRKLEDKGKILRRYLEQVTPYKYKVLVPASYIAVVEAFGTKRADVACLATFGYILANEKYGAEARLVIIRFGDAKYKAQIIAHADGSVKKLEDINGKTFAFTDPSSASGYLMPNKLFREKHIKPSHTVFLQKHDSVVTAVYQKRVDAGATFYTPPEEGKIQDARRLVKTQFPDVEEKVKIIAYTDEIPNDPFIFRKDLPEEMKEAITKGLEEFVKTKEGKSTLYDLYGVTDLKRTTDKSYDPVRELLKNERKSADQLLKK